MTKTYPYSTRQLDVFHEILSNLKLQGRPKDFQIKVDDFVCVDRTDDISKFYWFKKSLTSYSKEIKIRVFHGKSRNYDEYILIRNGHISPDPNMTPDEYIKSEVEKRLKIQQQEREYGRLKEKTKSQKKRIRSLEEQITELKSKSKAEIQDILKVIQKMMAGNKGNPETPPDLNGIPNEKLIEMLQFYRSKLGDDIFAKALGIMLKAASHPELLDDIDAFIDQKLKQNEKQGQQ